MSDRRVRAPGTQGPLRSRGVECEGLSPPGNISNGCKVSPYKAKESPPTMTARMPDPSLERCSTCFFPTEFHEVPLIGVKQYNYDTKIFTFGLPEGGLVHWHNPCE